MPIRDSMIHDVFVVIDINDESTYDTDFINQIKYGRSYVFDGPEFTDEEREDIAHNPKSSHLGRLSAGKFVIRLYADRFMDFINEIVADCEWKRSLTFIALLADAEEEEDLESSDTHIAHVYELTTLEKLGKLEDSVEDFLLDEEDDSEPDIEQEALEAKRVRYVH